MKKEEMIRRISDKTGVEVDDVTKVADELRDIFKEKISKHEDFSHLKDKLSDALKFEDEKKM